MKVSVKKHKKYHRRARTHKAVILKKYGTSIIVRKNKKVKKITYFDVIKGFDLEQMAHFLANFRFINQEQRDIKLIKRILESEAHL